MSFVTTSGEQTVAELAARVYGVGERTAVARRAAKELRELNPQLEAIGDLKPGTLVELPELDDTEPGVATPGMTEIAPGAFVADLRASLEPLSEALAAEADDAREAANERLKELRSATVKRAAGDQSATEELRQATAAAEARAESARATKAEWNRAIAELSDDLDDLLAVLGGEGTD